MQMLIDVPDKTFQRIKADKYSKDKLDEAWDDLEALLDAFDGGIVIPKGHGRLLTIAKIIFKKQK